MAQISVIVPVYRVEPYLKRCVDSILSQTFTDFDVILVDDGSPDQCGEICEAYSRSDARVHTIHQANGGLSAARNTGIDWAFTNSDSQWLTFVDSDDWLHPEFLQAALRAAEIAGSDVVIGECMHTQGEPFPENISLEHTMKPTEAYYNANGITGTVAWGKLYKKECFRELRYPVGKVHEDEFVTYRILFQYEQIPVIEAPLYAYFQNPESITGKTWSVKRLAALEALEQQVAFFQSRGFHKAAKARAYALGMLNMASQENVANCEALSNAEKKTYISSLEKDLRQFLKRYSSYKYISLWNRGDELLIYANAFPLVRCGLAVWRVFKKAVKCIPGVRTAVKKYREKRQRAAQVREYARQQVECQSILLQTPLHENLGDHAIAMAELQILHDLHISFLEYPWTAGTEPQYAGVTPEQKTILIHGGGFLGSLWKEEELRFRAELTAFHRNRIIVFPQTVFFDMRSEEGRAFFEESKRIYSSHPDLTLFLRERYSYDFMKQHMPEIHVELVPDVVMLLKPDIAPRTREGALICLRGDLEKTMPPKQQETMIRILQASFPSVQYTDTVLSESVSPEHREQAVREKLTEFSSAQIVLTDRLHGMIFAAVTETPCIVCSSRSHKVKGCYEWLKDLDYIRFVDDPADLPAAIQALGSVEPGYLRKPIEAAMQPLYDAIREGRS